MERENFETLRRLFSENEIYNLDLDAELTAKSKSSILSKGYYVHITPADFELSGIKQGKLLRQTPKSLKNVYQDFFDEHNRIIFRIEMESNPQIIGRVICQYEAAHVLIYRYVSGKLSAVQMYIPLQNVLLAKGRRGEYKYEYCYDDTGRLIKVVRHQAYNTEKISSNDFIFEYNGNEIKLIRRECPNGYRELIYEG